MTRSTKWLTLAVVMGAFLVPRVKAQDEPKVSSEEIDQKVTALEKALDDKDAATASSLMNDLVAMFSKADDTSAHKDIASTIGKGISHPTPEIRMAAAKALGQLGDEASRYLKMALNSRAAKEDLPLRLQIVESMGKTADIKIIADLKRLLNDKEFAIIAKAAEAMGDFENAPLRVRIQLVDELLKIYTSASNNARDVRNTEAVRKHNLIKEDMNRSLAKLTGQSFTDADAWWKWYGDAKKNPKAWKQTEGDSGQ